MDPIRRFWLIAGPDGVRKTTYAFRNVPALSGSKNFVNLDEIARRLVCRAMRGGAIGQAPKTFGLV